MPPRTKYGELHVTLNNFRIHLDKDFRKKADEDGILAVEMVPELLEDWGTTLMFDTDDAKEWIKEDNPKIKGRPNFNRLTFDEFYRLFVQWLVYEEENAVVLEENTENEKKQNLPWFNQDSPTRADTMTLPLNYQRNKRKLEQYLKLNKADIEEHFKCRVLEGDEIAIQDLFPFLEASFHIEGKNGLMILERPHDQEDFFQSINSYKRLFAICSDYMIRRKGLRKGDFEIKEVSLKFDDCFDLLDYWFSTDKEVVVLRDNEFAERQQVPENAPESDAIKTLKETIAKCENVMNECKNETERKILMSTINTLREKLSTIQGGETPHILSGQQEEKKIKALKEIYYFYSKQHVRYGVFATFDSIKREQQVMNLGEFSFIVKDFELLKNPSDKLKIAEVFKKCSSNNKELELIEFKKALERLALHYYKDDPKYHTDSEKVEAFYYLMGLTDGTYRKKIRDRQVAFHTKEKKAYRIPDFFHGYQFKIRASDGRDADEIRDELQRRKELRDMEKARKMQPDFSLNQPSFLPSTNTSRRYDGLSSPIHDVSYTGIQHKKALYALNQPEKNKISLKKLEKYNYEDVKGLDENFDPNDLIEENDEEDNVYLAEYNIQQDHAQRELMRNLEQKRLEDYGKIRSPRFKINIPKMSSQTPSQLNPTKHTQSVESSVDNGTRRTMSRNPSQDVLKVPKMHTRNLSQKNLLLSPTEFDSKLPYMSTNTTTNKTTLNTPRGYNLKTEMLERAEQIERDKLRKEQERMKNMYSNHEFKIRRGMEKYIKY